MFREEETFLVEYTTGNDYACSCCRNTFTDTEEFDVLGDAVQFCMGKMIGREINGDDVEIDGLRRSSPEVTWHDIHREYKETYEALLRAAKIKKSSERLAKANEAERKKMKAELAELERLKKKYEDT